MENRPHESSSKPVPTGLHALERKLAGVSDQIRALTEELWSLSRRGEIPPYEAAPDLHDRLDKLTALHARLRLAMRAWSEEHLTRSRDEADGG